MPSAWCAAFANSPLFFIHPIDLGLLTANSSLLREAESVVLYVAHDNPAANKVYDRVGFVGLRGQDGSVRGVDPWIEIGFDQEVTELGHW